MQHDLWDLRSMVASTRAAPLAAQTPSAAADDDRDEPLVDRRLLEASFAESHQGVLFSYVSAEKAALGDEEKRVRV